MAISASVRALPQALFLSSSPNSPPLPLPLPTSSLSFRCSLSPLPLSASHALHRRDASRSRVHRIFTCRSSHSGAAGGTRGALTPELKESLDKFMSSHKVVLFMKGTKMFPQCGFSNTVVQILNSLNTPFETVNILEDDALRMGLKEYSNWPTFPQLYIDGEFFGGCDITLAAYQSGELQELLEKAMCS
eukprot:c19741_g1_i1 orf=87-653(+)